MRTIKRKYFAIPLREDGTERLGTEGVFVGEYLSHQNFLRYRVAPNATNPYGYAIYLKSSTTGNFVPIRKWYI